MPTKAGTLRMKAMTFDRLGFCWALWKIRNDEWFNDDALEQETEKVNNLYIISFTRIRLASTAYLTRIAANNGLPPLPRTISGIVHEPSHVSMRTCRASTEFGCGSLPRSLKVQGDRPIPSRPSAS